MKKIYIEPSIEQTKISITRMLCLSGGLGGEATKPARSREFWGLTDDDEDFYDNSLWEQDADNS